MAIKYVINPSFDLRASLHLRKRAQARSKFRLNKDSPDVFFSTLLKVHTLRGDLSTLQKELGSQWQALVHTGIVVPANEAVTEVVPHFPLDHSVDHLLTPLFLREREKILSRMQGLRLTPFLKIQTGRERPQTKWGELPPSGDFPEAGPLAWVFDPSTQMWNFFHLSRKTLAWLQALQSGRKKIKTLSDSEKYLLLSAGLLTTNVQLAARQQLWKKHALQQKKLQRTGIAKYAKLYSDLQLAHLRSYCRSLLENGYFYQDETQVRRNRRMLLPRDPYISFLHQQMGFFIRQITGEPLHPYNYAVAKYLSGAELRQHRDKLRLKWNVSIALDAEPDLENKSAWALRVADQDLRLEFGEAAFFRGREHFHSRAKLPKPRSETFLLYFYTPVTFVGNEVDPEIKIDGL